MEMGSNYITMRNIHTYALKFINILLESILSGYTQKMYKSVKFESPEGNGKFTLKIKLKKKKNLASYLQGLNLAKKKQFRNELHTPTILAKRCRNNEKAHTCESSRTRRGVCHPA